MQIFVAFLYSLWLGCSFASSEISKLDIDQISNRTSRGGATNFATWNQAQQSFVPHVPHLDSVEVAITPGNPGPPTKVRLKILNANVALMTKELKVQPDFSGPLRIDISDKNLELVPGSPYWIRLEEDSITFFWKYDTPNPYADGEAYFHGHPIIKGDVSSFRFRTSGH